MCGEGVVGRRIEIEVKAPKGRMREEQLRFKKMIELHGGVHIVARSTEDVADVLTGLDIR